MTNRRVLSAVTLVVLLGILVTGAYIGWKRLSEPVGETQAPKKTAGPHCDAGVSKGDVVRTRDVTVSVYNAGDRTGLASQTMSELEATGVHRRRGGQRPERPRRRDRKCGSWRAPRPDPAARLVARQFGKHTLIQAVKRDLGPGVEVIVGDDFVGLVKAPVEDQRARRRLRLLSQRLIPASTPAGRAATPRAAGSRCGPSPCAA